MKCRLGMVFKRNHVRSEFPASQIAAGYSPAPGTTGATGAYSTGLAVDVLALLIQPVKRRSDGRPCAAGRQSRPATASEAVVWH